MLENEVDKLTMPQFQSNQQMSLAFGGPSVLDSKKEIVCPLCHSKQVFSSLPSAGINLERSNNNSSIGLQGRYK